MVKCRYCDFWKRKERDGVLYKSGWCHIDPPSKTDGWAMTDEDDFCGKGESREHRYTEVEHEFIPYTVS